MHSIRQSSQSALQGSLARCTFTHGATRAFSRSSACARGALPVFLEASKPELSSLLQTLNSQVLLPAHLTKEQQKLVYRQENKAKLEAEPVEITLGDVTLALEHLDRNRLPNRWATLRSIVSESETREDWENVVRMLEGFESAGIPVKSGKQSFIVRRLNLHGMQHLVLKALQRAKATGLRMRERDVVVQVLRSVYDKPAMSDWDADETKKALRMARQVAELLEDPEHCGTHTRQGVSSGHDFRGDPAVIAVPTALAAVLALRHGGDAAEVKTLAGRLVPALQQADYTAKLDALAQRTGATEADFNSRSGQGKYLAELTHDLPELIFINTALKTARQVLQDEMPMAAEAQQFESRNSEVLNDAVAAIERLRSRGGNVVARGTVDYITEVTAKTP